MDVGTIWLVAGAVNLLVLILFFVMLSRIETATKNSAELLEMAVHELQALNSKALEAQRNGLRIERPVPAPESRTA